MAAFQDASVKEVHASLGSGSCKYLDVRTAEEFGEGHPPGAINVPVMLQGAGGAMEPNPDFLAQVQARLPDTSAPVAVGCRSGRRSVLACQEMAAAGYTRLSNVLGGIQSWQAEGLPVEAAPREPPKITTREGHELVSQGATYLDVRTPEEYAAGHAPGVVHVPVAVNAAGGRQPNADFVGQVRAAIPDTSTPLCVACMGGARAESAASQLLAAGYRDVKQMTDGFRGWLANGLPVEQPQQQQKREELPSAAAL